MLVSVFLGWLFFLGEGLVVTAIGWSLTLGSQYQVVLLYMCVCVICGICVVWFCRWFGLVVQER